MIRALRAGLSFLTTLPVGYDAAADAADPGDASGRARAWDTALYPAVGLLIGSPLFGLMMLPLPPLPRAALVLAVWVVLTGGLHEDGWADTLDAAFAPVDRARRLEILKDPRIGAHGLTGTVLIQIARFAVLAVVPPTAALVAPVVGRWGMAVSLGVAPSARPDGLGARAAAGARPIAATVVAAALLALLALVSAYVTGSVIGTGARIAVAWTAAAVAAGAWGGFLCRRFGGLTGDGHGAIGLLAELVALGLFVPV